MGKDGASITLAIIAKDEIDKLENIVEKYAKYFDKIVIGHQFEDKTYTTINSISDKVELYKYELNEWEKEFGGIDFARKRNWLAEKVTTDYYFRIDTDDLIINIENVQAMADEALKRDTSIVYCYYDYSRDQHGNTHAGHYRETLIKNDNNLFWNKKIHENILPINRTKFSMKIDETVKIYHNVDDEHADKSSLRNIRYLIDEFEQDKENTDPRTLAYLGRMLASVGAFDKARFFLEQHIKKSGWDEDRYQSWCQLSHIFQQQNNFDQAVAAATEAILDCPHYPDAYFQLHDIYFAQEKWQKAIDWSTIGFERPIPKSMTVVDEAGRTWRPILSTAHCFFALGKFKQAMALFNQAAEYVKDLDYIKEQRPVYEQALKDQEDIDGLCKAIQESEDDAEALNKIVSNIPERLEYHEIVAKIKQRYLPPTIFNDKTIEIFCGETAHFWSPEDVKTGIGGSEEATIYISKCFTALGYKVIVYGKFADKEGEYDGVTYKNWYRFSTGDKHNIVISWRCNMFVLDFEAAKKIIWLHDLPINIDWEDKSLDSVDSVIALSQYHADMVPECISRDKVYISRNGIVPEHFTNLKTNYNKNKILYASSYDRGLEILLENWPKVREANKDAELHIYYGWNIFDKITADHSFKDRMVELMKQDGVYENGRIGHEELLKEYATSAVYAYPCTYKGEIQCIALTKAIACGCDIITNDYAIMAERSPNAVSDDKFIGELCKIVKDPKPSGLNLEYIESMSWDNIAKEWSDDLFSN